MAIRVLRYENDPILRKKCRIVDCVDDRIREILEDMMDTLHHTENGAAIAAPQVGILKRLVVCRGLSQSPGSVWKDTSSLTGYGTGAG